jgi:hypothetical protein
MSAHPKTNPSASVTVDRAALRALKAELAQERQATRRLQLELTREVEVARRAAEETLTARAEREKYRCVLAAAVANEKRAGEEVSQARAESERLEGALLAAERARGEAQGRTHELERQRVDSRAEHEHDLERVTGRAWADAESKGMELQQVHHERGVALGQVRELLRRVPDEVPASARVAALRARLCLGAALFSLALFLVFLAPLVSVVFVGEAVAWPAMVGGMSAWSLVWLELFLLGVSVGLATWAVRNLRWVERATRAQVDLQTRGSSGPEVRSPSPV